MKIFGLGHEKNGSSYLYHLLNANGIKVGHEWYTGNGIIGFNAHEHQVEDISFFYTRDPRQAVHSVMRFFEEENKYFNQYGKKIKTIYEKLKIDISDINGIDRAIASLWYWKEICFMHNPNHIFRVDIDPISKLESIVQNPIIVIDVHKNEGRKVRYDLSQASDIWLERLDRLAKDLGYPL